MRPWMFDNLIAKRASGAARHFGRLWWFETHVIPAEILKAATDLVEPLRPHRWAGRALASEKTGGKRRKRLGFSGHLNPLH